MKMDIQIHSKLSPENVTVKLSDTLVKLKVRFGQRFWCSDVAPTGDLTKEIVMDDFGFHSVSSLLVTDTTKQFDDFDTVTRLLRSAIGEENSIVIYADTGRLFPEIDYD
ncbi:hypothetical protein QTO30_10165 [Yoonia sp. GPGPB17]|uniref:hypothetical protein n=1 Tax=Yoonia sp. GPGPB17 TaxID=3026147 RepID=UPI0030C20BC2